MCVSERSAGLSSSCQHQDAFLADSGRFGESGWELLPFKGLLTTPSLEWKEPDCHCVA